MGYKFTGTTKEEALQRGLRELGLSLDDVDIEILSDDERENEAVVCLTPKAYAEATGAEKSGESSYERRDRRPERPERKAEKIYSREELENQADASIRFMNELLNKTRLNLGAGVEIRDNEIYINIEGEEAGCLIGHRGETLDALQLIVSACSGGEESPRVHVDAANYRERRREHLVVLADRMARKAAKTGRVVELEPMNPYDRRVIHTKLQDDRFVITESRGEGKFRHVVIIPKERGRGGDRPFGDRGRDRGDRREDRGNRVRFTGNAGEESYGERPQAPSVINESISDTPKEINYGGSDFSRKGPSKFRSFSGKPKRF
jgi:spoIIIJ-associated protein